MGDILMNADATDGGLSSQWNLIERWVHVFESRIRSEYLV
jgi:hypothetical protein